MLGHGAAFMERLGRESKFAHRKNTHNSFMQITVAFGLIGLLALVAFYYTILKESWLNRRGDMGRLFLVLITVTLVYGVFGDMGYSKTAWVLFGAIVNAHGYLRSVQDPAPLAAPMRRAGPRMRGVGPPTRAVGW